MRIVLRIAALAIVIVGLALWFFGGMNRGWTKTSVQILHVDEVTGQTYPVWEKRFLPGVEFLGATLGGAAMLAGVSFLFARK